VQVRKGQEARVSMVANRLFWSSWQRSISRWEVEKTQGFGQTLLPLERGCGFGFRIRNSVATVYQEEQTVSMELENMELENMKLENARLAVVIGEIPFAAR
jgi:hypothetical protein